MSSSKNVRTSRTGIILGLIFSLALSLIAFEYTVREPNLFHSKKPLEIELTMVETEEMVNVQIAEEVLNSSRQKGQVQKVFSEFQNQLLIKAVTKESVPPELKMLNDFRPRQLKIPEKKKNYSISEMNPTDYPHFENCKNDDPFEQYRCTQWAIMDFLQKETRYPEIPRQLRIEGTVYVSFVVNEKGSIQDANIIRSVDSAIDLEALRVIEMLPKFAPGRQNGNAVRVRFELPIRFNLAKN